jgi:FMN phosphatase YigB (HAD superfamily)
MMKQSASITLQGRRIRCLLFDLGETLWIHCDQATMERITEQQARQCATLLQTYIPALPPSISDYYQWSVQLRQAISARYQAWRYQDYEQEPDPILVTAQACQDASLPLLERTQLAYLFETFRPPLAAARILLDGVLETLQVLRTHGMLLGCVTDRWYGGLPFREDLRRLGLLEYFAPEAIIVSADCGKRKPHPIPFCQAMTALNVSAEETAVVGDFLSRDIAGAKRLQMTAIWKPKERLLQQVSMSCQGTQQEDLLHAARYEEETMYPEVPFSILEPFLQPDAIIKNVTELLSLLT